MGFVPQSGNVTVDSETKTKAPISYEKFELEIDTEFLEVCEQLQKHGITEEIVTEKDEEGETKIVSTTDSVSLTQLLVAGLNTFNYTGAVAKAKDRFNNSPVKTESNLSKMLKALIENPDATKEQIEGSKTMLAQLESRMKTT